MSFCRPYSTQYVFDESLHIASAKCVNKSEKIISPSVEAVNSQFQGEKKLCFD